MWKKQERKTANAEFLNLLGQIDSEIHMIIILQEEKNLGMFHFLALFSSETKCKSQPLHMKQPYFVQIELLQF